jgi:prepilin-type N-terminal cleavage/methylation domain-containing protein
MRVRVRHAHRRAGYTLIEVMMAIAVMTAGAVAIMAMHQATTHGNFEARRRTTATELCATWIERLHRDAMQWNVGGPGIPFSPLHLSRTQYLRTVTAPGALPRWQVPMPRVGSGESFAFDHWGRDTFVRENMVFCTNLRLAWVYVGQAIRADVRIWWPRTGESARTADLQGCAAGTDPETLTARLRDIHFAYATTVLRWTPVRGGT